MNVCIGSLIVLEDLNGIQRFQGCQCQFVVVFIFVIITSGAVNREAGGGGGSFCGCSSLRNGFSISHRR